MQTVKFTAPEYHSDGHFESVEFQYIGSLQIGWNIYRKGEKQLHLGPGFILMKGLACGICSTDLARRFLPFPLPQVIGHEFIGEDKGHLVAVDINSSHKARGVESSNCPWCSSGLETHCPERITLGINQQPGGFAPWVLVPQNGLHILPHSFKAHMGTLIEPFSAALHSVHRSLSPHTKSVAVLGPRKLGMMTLMALLVYKKDKNPSLIITALSRHSKHAELCKQMGADNFHSQSEGVFPQLENNYDVVFDTTGSPKGFSQALQLSKKIVHVKSTHGKEVMGVKHFTEFVVNEMTLLRLNKNTLNQSHWSNPSNTTKSLNILVSPLVTPNEIKQCKEWFPTATYHQVSLEEAFGVLDDLSISSLHTIPRFDKAIISDAREMDELLVTENPKYPSLIKERGAFLWASAETEHENIVIETNLSKKVLKDQIEIHSSRCGDFAKGIQALSKYPELMQILDKDFITNRFSLKDLPDAMKLAADSNKSLKIVIDVSGLN